MALTAYITFSASSPLTFSMESRLTTETPSSPLDDTDVLVKGAEHVDGLLQPLQADALFCHLQ